MEMQDIIDAIYESVSTQVAEENARTWETVEHILRNHIVFPMRHGEITKFRCRIRGLKQLAWYHGIGTERVLLGVVQYGDIITYEGRKLKTPDDIRQYLHDLALQRKPSASHLEYIKCPRCGMIQVAEVRHTIPFPTFIHTCNCCRYVITESEWEKVRGAKPV